jgi:hypothetical protein
MHWPSCGNAILIGAWGNWWQMWLAGPIKTFGIWTILSLVLGHDVRHCKAAAMGDAYV